VSAPRGARGRVPAGPIAAAALLAIVFGAALVVLVRTGREAGRARAGRVPADSVAALADSLDAWRERARALEAALAARPALAPEDAARFARLGLADPERAIRAAALGQSALIPFRGVLGGTMRVVEARVLDDHWVLAEFEDGHVAGSMMLEYRVVPGGTIVWRRLAAYLD